MNWLAWAALILLLPAALYVAAEDPQTVDVAVLAALDSRDTDRITEVHVRVHNPGPEAIEPVFSIPAGALMNWYAWPFDGPAVLGPGQTGTYVLHQGAYTGVPVTHAFRVIVNDGDIEGRSALFKAKLSERPSVINPGLTDWAPSMFYQDALPFGWAPFHVLHDATAHVSGGDGNLSLRLETDGPKTSMAAIHQRIDFPRTFRVEGAVSGGLGGAILEDLHANKRLELVFGPEDEAAFREGHVDVVRVQRPGPVIEADVQAIWEDQGWDVPAKQFLDRRFPHSSGDMGVGLRGLPVEQGRLEFFRPLEMRLFVAADHAVEGRFAFAGGPALDPAPSRH